MDVSIEVLMGVGLNRLTFLHLAEQLAGRTLFRRWANGQDGTPMEVEVGGCSHGFVKLEPVLVGHVHAVRVGRSDWRVYPADAALRAAAAAILDDPDITRCAAPAREWCADAILSGPIVSAGRR